MVVSVLESVMEKAGGGKCVGECDGEGWWW